MVRTRIRRSHCLPTRVRCRLRLWRRRSCRRLARARCFPRLRIRRSRCLPTRVCCRLRLCRRWGRRHLVRVRPHRILCPAPASGSQRIWAARGPSECCSMTLCHWCRLWEQGLQRSLATRVRDHLLQRASPIRRACVPIFLRAASHIFFRLLLCTLAGARDRQWWTVSFARVLHREGRAPRARRARLRYRRRCSIMCAPPWGPRRDAGICSVLPSA